MEEIGLEPPCLLEPDVQSRAEQRNDAENDEIAIIRLQLRHIGEIHTVDAGDRRRHRKDRRPGGELARDHPLSLLLEQMGRLEHRGENFAQTPDPRLDTSDVIEHVLKIRPHVPVERRKRDMRQLVANLVHRPQHALEADQFAPQGEQRSARAPSISGISDVGEKPSSAGARTAWASTGRPVDWWSRASESAARSSKLRVPCRLETAIAVWKACSAGTGFAESRFTSISPRTRCSSASNVRCPIRSDVATASSRVASARSTSPARASAPASAILRSPSK